MARPVKKGLDYFPTDVDIFSDTKLKIVRAHFGSDGVLLYFYLLCAIYKNGFYIVCDDDFRYVISADLGMTDEKIGQMLSFFLKRSLFDDTLFKADKILTSKGIQRRYQEAIKQRALKNPVQVEAKFWVLEKNETQSFIKVRPDENYSENNNSFSENNDSFFENNPHKVKESKVNKSRGCSSDYGLHGLVRLTEDEYGRIREEIGEIALKDYINRLDSWLTGHKISGNHANVILKWYNNDNRDKPKGTGQTVSAVDVNALFGEVTEDTI